MRTLIYAALLTMLAQPVWAITTEGLLKSCKPFADNAFELSNPKDPRSSLSDGICAGHMVSTVEQASALCSEYKQLKKWFSDREYAQESLNFFKTFAHKNGTSATLKDIYAVIQTFINWAEANPAKWRETPNKLWLSETFPCKE